MKEDAVSERTELNMRAHDCALQDISEDETKPLIQIVTVNVV